MVDFQIKNIFALGSASGMALKQFGSILLNIPKNIIKTVLRIQMEIVYFPFRFLNALYRIIFKQSKDCNCGKSVQVNSDPVQDLPCDKSVQASPDAEQDLPCDKSVQAALDSEQDLSCDKSVQATSDLLQESSPSVGTGSQNQNTLSPLTSSDYLRYSELVKKRTLTLIDELSSITNCMSSANKATEALRSNAYLQFEKEKLSQELSSSAKDTLTEPVQTIKQVFRENNSREFILDEIVNLMESSPAAKNKSFPKVSKRETSIEETRHNGQQVLNLSIEVLRNLVDIIMQEILLLKRKIVSTNSKVEEVLKSSGSLVVELSLLNERYGKLETLSSKIKCLQNELGEGNKLLKEIEADRNHMKLKLDTLDRLIKEEEEYLDDASLESGYDDLETRAASPYKNGYF